MGFYIVNAKHTSTVKEITLFVNKSLNLFHWFYKSIYEKSYKCKFQESKIETKQY